MKSYRLLTHHPTAPSSLWRELRDELPPPLGAKPNIYASDLSWEFLAVVLDRYMAGIGLLVDGGRLGAVLFQFPRYVYPSRRSYGYLEWLAARLDDVQTAVEFRQSRWMDDGHRVSTLDFLAANGLAYVSADEPQGFPISMPRSEALHHGTRPVRVLMNNCYSDYAVRAARTLSAQLISHHPVRGTGDAAFQ
ncbi:MAG: DUF72 domain-containing protein [Acidimicrobiales bacterium]